MPTLAPVARPELEGPARMGLSSYCCGRIALLGTGWPLIAPSIAELVAAMTLRGDAVAEGGRAVDEVAVEKVTTDENGVVVGFAAGAFVVDDGKVGVWAIAVSVGIDLVEEDSVGREVDDAVRVRIRVLSVSSSSVSVSLPIKAVVVDIY